MSDTRSTMSWDSEAMRHSPAELWVMMKVAAGRGIDIERCLMGTLLDLETLCNRRTRVSFAQHLEVQRRLTQILGNGPWPLQVAARLHLTSFGMAGYALLSSDTLASAIQLARRYAPLLNLKHALEIRCEGSTASLRLSPGYTLGPADTGPTEVIEVIKLANLLSDICGRGFRLTEIRLAGPLSAEQLDELSKAAHVPASGGHPVTEIRFPAELLERRLPQSDALTCRACQDVCEQQLAAAARFDKTSGRVRALLENCVDSLPTMTDVARQLCMSPRSLRRRLEAENTSFNQIVDNIRRSFAEKMLKTTNLSTESIAELLGYGDAANFRHAFKRWTGESPRRFRQLQSGSEGETAYAPSGPSPTPNAAAWETALLEAV